MQRNLSKLAWRTIVFAAGILWGAGQLHGQALPTMKRPGAYLSVGGGYSYYQVDYGQRKLGGAMAFVDLNMRPHYGLEAEGRLLNMNQVQGVHAANYLAGPRVTLWHPYGIAPYVKVLAGGVKLYFPNNLGNGTYFTVAAGGGVDWTLNQRWRWRVADVEYQLSPDFKIPASPSPISDGSLHSFGVSTGLSFSFP
jgi:hypothetical protein